MKRLKSKLMKPALATCALACALTTRAQQVEDVLIQAPEDVLVEVEQVDSTKPKRIMVRELDGPDWGSASETARKALESARSHVRILHDKALDQKTGESLIITHTPRDAKAREMLEEDLAIMSRILTKVTEESSGGGEGSGWRAMGIPILRGLGGGGPKSIYIEGHGVVFLLDIAIPLKPVEQTSKEPKAATPERDAWEAARKELFGGESRERRLGAMEPKVPRGASWFGIGEEPQYDAEKVEKLRAGLLDALKHAANIRGLSPSDTITLALRGPVANVQEKVVEQDGGKTVVQDVLITGGAPQKISMVLSVNVGLATSFSKGSASMEDLKAAARITIH